MTEQTEQQEKHTEPQSPNTALACFLIAMQYLHRKVDEAALTEQWGGPQAPPDLKVLCQLAREQQFKAQIIRPQADGLQQVPIPAIARLQDDSYVVLGWNDGKNVFISNPQREHPYAQPLEEFVAQWSGELLVFTSGLDWRRLAEKYSLRWFYSVIVHFKKYWRDVFAASFVLQLFGIVVPLFTQVIIDKVLGYNGVSTLDVLGVALVAFGVFQCLIGILRTYILTHTTNKMDVILGSRLFRHLVALPLPYFEHRRVGDTMMRVGALSSIREFLTGTAITVLLDVFFSIVFVLVMLWYSVSLTIVGLAIVPFYVFMNVVVTPAYKQRVERVWASGAENNAFLVEAVTGMQTVKSLAIEPQFRHRWENLLSQYVSRNFDSLKLGIGINGTAELLQLASTLSIFWFGGHMVMDGTLTLGQLIAFQMLARQANGPIMTLIGMWQQFQQTALSLERLGDILNTRPEPVLAPVRSDMPRMQGHVAFEGVSFRYRLDLPVVLSDISFSVPPGTKVGIVGRSGSGKSTLTKLIQRLYTPETGRILIDGHDIQQVPPAWLRSQIGVVLQENYLYNASVRDNIALARPGASILDVVRVARVAGAHEFILELPEGYDTKVGERGTSLSGGQRQRIAIARALLTDPRVLIFDEATSSLDYESERIIMQNLNLMAQGRTLYMIAHRLSTVRNCDVIVVLDHGRILEAGSHDELMEKKGLYYQLYMQQEG